MINRMLDLKMIEYTGCQERGGGGDNLFKKKLYLKIIECIGCQRGGGGKF